MPFIPTIQTEVDARVGAPGSHATGQEFGAEIGAATQQLGQAFGNLGSAFASKGKEEAARKDALTQATSLATSSFTPIQNKIETDYPDPTGAGLPDTMKDANLKWIDEQYAADIKGGMSKKNADAVKLARLRQVPGNVDQAANQATKLAGEHATLSSKDALESLKNDVFLHGATTPDDFQKKLELGYKVIDNQPGSTVTQRQQAKLNWDNDLASARFDAMLRAAHTPADVAALKKQLDDPYWKGKFVTAELQRQSLQLDQSAQRWAVIGTDAHINEVRADPANYDKAVKAGLDEIIATPDPDGAVQATKIKQYRSDLAQARFESKAEKLALEPTPANRAGLEQLQKELKDPKWSGEMTQADYKAQTDSLITHMNQIDAALERQHNKLDSEHDKQVTQMRAEHNATLSTLKTISKEYIIPSDTMNTLFAQRAALGELGAVTPEEEASFNEIYYNQKAKAATVGVTSAAKLDEIKRGILNKNETRFSRTKGLGRAGAGGGGGISYTAPNGVRVESGIIDQTSVRGMQPRAYDILDGMAEAAGANGITRLVITAAAGGGHKSHSQGTEWDVVGYRADGSKWNGAQRVAVARGGFRRGGDRAGLYEGGNMSLHMGYSGPGRPAAIWGAGGLTGGDASRAFRDPASAAFLTEVGGGAAGGRGGGGAAGRRDVGVGFRNALIGFESSGDPRVVNPIMTTSGNASGLYQITSETWKDFGGLATGYKTAGEAPPDVQRQIADKIPIERWAAETLNKMQKAGWTIHPGKTLAENAALNGDTPGGAGGPNAGDIPAAGVSQPYGGVTPAQAQQISVIDDVAQKRAAAMNADMMTYYSGATGLQLSTLSSNGDGWAQRASDYATAIERTGASGNERQPFTEPELAGYKNLMAGTDNDAKLQLFSNIAKWPDRQMQDDAFRQLGKVDPYMASLGRLVADNQLGLARSAMAGNAAIKALPSGVKPTWQDGSDKAYIETMGDAIRGMDPRVASEKKQLYDSLYADQYGLRHEYNQEQYEAIVERVEGGKFDTVNGLRTLAPNGVPPGYMEKALPNIDWSAVSISQTPIMARDPSFDGKGGLSTPSEWALSNAHLIRTGDGEYALADDKDQFFVTQLPNGDVVPFGATLTAKVINEAATKTLEAKRSSIGAPNAVEGSIGASPQMTDEDRADRNRILNQPNHLRSMLPVLPENAPPATGSMSKAAEEQAKSSVETYRSVLIRNGVSEAEASKMAEEFMSQLRNNYLSKGK
jgi:hypothetical protein